MADINELIARGPGRIDLTPLQRAPIAISRGSVSVLGETDARFKSASDECLQHPPVGGS